MAVSNFSLWKGIVEGNRCGITVDPLGPKEIAQAIEYLLTHPEEARRMGEKAVGQSQKSTIGNKKKKNFSDSTGSC